MNNWYDILQMTQITHRLFVGGYARAADLAKENPHKITAVLCVHQVMDYPKNPDIIYMHVPFADGESIPPKSFIKCLGWLKFMYENGHVIYIHCAAGISRSVTIMASFMHYEGILEFNEALDRIKLNRPSAGPARSVLNSAKQMLKVYPYDGSFESQPEHMKAVHSELIEAVQNRRAAMAHTNEECPMRQFLLSGDLESDVPRHEIPCNCEKLLSALEIAQIKDAIQVPAVCIQCGKGAADCECFDGFI
jgi:protein-tyrosine phosphatase